MKVSVLAVVFFVGSAFGDEAPYPPSGWKPQGALLVLPQYGPPQNETNITTTQQTPQDEPDLEKVNDSVMERLRQEEGSDRGVYYVYLPDGRLQRVQYTTAPLKKAPTQASHQTSFQNNQQVNHQLVFGTHQINTQGNGQSLNKYQQGQYQQGQINQYQTQSAQYQNPAIGDIYQAQQQLYQTPNQYQAQFQAAQFGQYNAVGQNVYPDATSSANNGDNKNRQEEESGDPSQLLAQYSRPNPEISPIASLKLQQNQPASYVASVQFKDVPPISGPIYAYNPSPLVRVVRYAPLYQ